MADAPSDSASVTDAVAASRLRREMDIAISLQIWFLLQAIKHNVYKKYIQQRTKPPHGSLLGKCPSKTLVDRGKIFQGQKRNGPHRAGRLKA
jgi:hypothetical protein